MSSPQGGGPVNVSSVLALPNSSKDELITAMQAQHRVEREQDRARIASLEQYIE